MKEVVADLMMKSKTFNSSEQTEERDTNWKVSCTESFSNTNIRIMYQRHRPYIHLLEDKGINEINSFDYIQLKVFRQI